MSNFSKMLKNERINKGLSLRKLSQMSGIPATTIHAYERGINPTIDKANKLLKVLGITIILGKVTDDA